MYRSSSNSGNPIIHITVVPTDEDLDEMIHQMHAVLASEVLLNYSLPPEKPASLEGT